MEEAVMIDLENKKGAILINPRHPDRATLVAKLQGHLSDHIWFFTSGSTGEAKGVALSKNALLASAQAVNLHLQASANDRWLNALPPFHVGGAGIFVRASLSGSLVYTLPPKWDPKVFISLAQEYRITLSALVPAQIFDLVQLGQPAPPPLRAIVVGGGALSSDLYTSAKKLNWPLLPSYGLTECASQVATANDTPELKLLSHIEAKVEGGLLQIKSPALLTAYAHFSNETLTLEDPKVNGWFTTEDRAHLNGPIVEILGRTDDFIKIGGESVDLTRLTKLIDQLKGDVDCALLALPDERLGHTLHLAHNSHHSITSLLEKYHAKVLPFERIRQTHPVPTIPRSPLGKILKGELTKLINDKWCSSLMPSS